jgi:hypothetical protein
MLLIIFIVIFLLNKVLKNYLFCWNIPNTTPPITLLIPLDFQWIRVCQVSVLLVQKLLNINFIIEILMKSKQKNSGQLLHELDIVGKPSIINVKY